MTSCPICQKPVDPIRASHIRVISGRVVPYCSAACRDADAARAAGPLSVPAPAGPAASAAAGGPPIIDAKPSASNTGSTGKQPEAKSEAKPDAKAEAKADAKNKPEAKVDAKPDAKSDVKSDDKAKAAAKSEAKPDAKSAAKSPEAKGDAKSDDKAKAPDKAAAKGKLDAKPDDRTKAAAPAKAEPSTLKADAGPAEAKAAARPDKPKPEPAVEPAAAAPPAAAARPVRNADEERDATLVPPEPRSRARLVLIALVVLAVGGVVVWQATRSEEAPPPPAPKVVEKLPPPPPPPPPTFDAVKAHARAVEVLRQHLTVESPRVRRFAAAALGRLGDADAVKTLLDLLPTEQMEIARLDIAYGLARAGNEEGVKMLVKGLSSARRDVKGDAARLLAALEDPRAESTLSSLLVLSQFRLGAAEQLARLGNKQAIALLQKLRADDKAPEEDRLRATIALGYAGQPEVAEALRALLPDSRFNVGAAGALAILHDASARQTLVEQLSIPSLRTSAALSLRRLEPELDAGKLLFRVMPDLDSIKDTERVAAAEAVLLLTGPATLAERD